VQEPGSNFVGIITRFIYDARHTLSQYRQCIISRRANHNTQEHRLTRSTGTVHTSAKARLSWLSVVGRWRNDVIVAMAMPAGACRALQRRAAQLVDTTFRISQWWRV